MADVDVLEQYVEFSHHGAKDMVSEVIGIVFNQHLIVDDKFFL